MTKLWFKTKNGQILDLNSILNFWIEDFPDNVFTIFCNDNSKDEITWRLAEFASKEEAQLYLNEIYQLLTTKTTHQLPDCLGQCDPTTSKGNSLCK